MQVLNIFRRTIIVYVLFVAVFSASGGEARAELPYQAEWTRQMGTSSSDYADDVSVDGFGNVYAVGCTKGGLDGYASAGDYDLFVVKYNSGGEKQWTRQMGTSSADYADGVSVDGAGDVYVAGSTFGGLDGNTSAGGYDLFVVKYDNAGVKQWTRQMGTAFDDMAYGMSVDGTGNVYVAGSTWGGLDGNTNAGADDLFVVKFDSDGVKQWTRQLGTYDPDFAFGVSVDGAGNVYVTGYTYGALDGNTSAGSDDLFVVKYDNDGVKQWTRQLGTDGWDFAHGVSLDGAGNVYVTGYTYGGLDGNTCAGENDVFVVKYDNNGVRQWTQQLGTVSYDVAHGVAVDGSGGVCVAGSTGGGLEGNTSSGSTDIFLLRLVPDPYSEITSPSDGATLTGTSTTIPGTSLASNGVAFVQVSTDGGASWQTASGTNPWNFAWSLPANGSYNLLSRATDSLSNVETPGPGISVTVDNLTIDSVSATPASPQPYGTEITFTTNASGGSGSYLYKYWRKGPDTGGVYIPQRDWDASPDWLWTPGVAQAGSNTIKAIVKNASGGATVQLAKSFSVTYPPIVIQAFGPTPVSPKPSGTLITWDTTVTGGSGSYLYCYYRKGPDTAGVYSLLQGWSASSSCPWTPGAAQAGWNTIMVKVKNASGGAITQTAKGFKVQ